jgi:hypothetical protein
MISPPVYGQTIQTPFGKNRVQYHDDFDNWWMYETQNFVTFWYGKGRNLAKTTMQLAEMDHRELEKILAHKMNDKIRIIIYLDHSDYSQSNIAYFDTREAGGAGLAQFYDNKIMVFFNGDHQDLRKQIRAGIVQAYVQSMFHGISIQELYQNMVSSELPNWFVAGLVDYLKEKWSPEMRYQLGWYFREEPRKVRKFSNFSKNFPVIAGHSMWHYLAAEFGEQSVSDFLYLVRIHNDINKAFKYIYNQDSRSIYRAWKKHYTEYFDTQLPESLSLENEALSLKTFQYPITRVRLDSAGNHLIYAINNFGRVELFMHDLVRNREKRLLKYGYRNEHQLTDNHYPLFKFDHHSGHLGVIYELRDELYFRELDLNTLDYVEVLFPEQVQRIYDFEFEQPGFLLLNASLDGFTDLYLFNIEKRQTEQVTDQYFDEMDLNTIHSSGAEFLLTSNQKGSPFVPVEHDSVPPVSDFDILSIDNESRTANNLTKTETVNESQAMLDENGNLLLLSNSDGLHRPQYWQYDGSQFMHSGSVVTFGPIDKHHYSNGNYVYVFRPEIDRWALAYTNVIKVYFTDPEFASATIKGFVKAQEQEFVEDEPLNAEIEIDESLLFQSEFDDPNTSFDFGPFDTESDIALTNPQTQGIASDLPVFNRSQAVASRLRFNFTDLVTRIDNQALFEGLETYDAYNTGYNPPPAGFLVKSSVRDLFEDHIIEGGFRLASDFRGMEYFISYDNLKRKWDWKYAFYRKSGSRFENLVESTPAAERLKTRTNIGLVRAKYPFDIYRSIQLTGQLRFDNTIVSATEAESLDSPDFGSQRLILDAAYIFDNTSEKAINLLSGTRYKAFARFSNRFNISATVPYNFELSEGVMGLIGFDARHYIDLLKHSVIAFRAAGQSSFGTEKNIYFLGGVENWFFGRYDETYPIPQEETFAFKVQAANVRGFPYNIRNGSTFVLANAEIRIPVFTYLFGGHIKNGPIRNFQVTGFIDTGMAWYGLTPFSEKNSANVYHLEAPPAVKLKIKQVQDPLVAGIGLGIRTTVFGYFLKLDYAWGIQSGKILDPMFYFSMGYDF